MEGLTPDGVIQARVDQIVAACACYYDVDARDVYSPNRNKTLVRTRHVSMYLARKHLKLSFPELGKAFGRDHASVQHAVKKINRLLEDDDKTRKYIEEIESLFPQSSKWLSLD